MPASQESPRLQINSSALHVFDVLRIVCAATMPIGVAELARRVALPTTTVHRALITLEEARYIRRSRNTAKYEPGVMAQFLAWTLFKRFKLSEASMPFLRRMSAETGETASMTARLGWYGLRIAVAYGNNDIYHRDRLGEAGLLHRSLSGNGIFAFLKDTEIDRYRSFVKQQHPAAFAELEGPDVSAKIGLARIRAWVNEELGVSPGSSAVAFPVRDPAGGILASITINGPVITGAEANESVSRLLAIRNELEALIRTDQSRFKSPYAHFDPDKIIIRLPEDKEK